ncbi:MAG: CHAT domain-containing tetratricopeptide repeat protein [Bacteroidota bacterium]
MRLALAISLIIGLQINSFSQEFNDEIYRSNKALVDSFYAVEAYPELDKALTDQVNYLIETARYDSLHDYVYKVGRAKTQLGDAIAGTSRAQELTDLIEKEDPDTSNILFAINELSWVYYEASMDSFCLGVDQRYLELCEQYKNASLEEQADAHYNLGFDYLGIGNTQMAIDHFEQSLDFVEKDSIGLLSKRVDCYNALGATYWRHGIVTKAKYAMLKSSELSLLLEDTVMASFYSSNAIGNLSLVYEDEGNLAKSMELLEEAIDLRMESLPHVVETYDRDIQQRHLVSNYHNLSALYLSIGDLERALSMTDYVYSLQQQYFPGKDDRREIGYYESKGTIQAQAGDYVEGEMNLLKSLELTEEKFGKVNFYTLNRHQRLGELYDAWNKPDEALYHINKTIEIGAAVTDEFSNQELAKAYQKRSHVNSLLKNESAALADLDQALEIFATGYGEDANPRGEILFEKAIVYSDFGRTDSASICLDEALRIFELNRNKFKEEEGSSYSGIVRFLPQALALKAKLINQGDEKSLLEAKEIIEKSLTYLSEERRNFNFDGSQLNFIDAYADIYNQATDITFELFQVTNDISYRDDVWRLAEERKTVLLKRQLNGFTSLRVSQVPDSIIAKECLLLKQLSDPDLIENYGELEQEYDELIQHIEDTFPEYFGLRYKSDIAEIKDVQRELLNDKESLIEYIQTEQNILAFIISKSSANLIELNLDEPESKIDRFNRSLISRDLRESQKLSAELSSSLFDPIEDVVKGTTIFIIPDGDIYALNFEALSRDDGKFLIEDYTISYLLSATTSVLYKDLGVETSENGIIALAPGFENNENQTTTGDKFIRQPFAMETAQVIGDLFSGMSLTAAQATEERFKSQADEHNIIHLGTHTEINTSSPMLSRLILSKSENDDGYLHAYEIYNLPLRAELAVLTACETGVGKESSSEGVLSIAHGFAYAGCPSLVMSLWEIDEKTSASIIESFYKYLADGDPKNSALRKAKLDYLKTAKGELKNPYYWSGIVLFGSTEPVNTISNHWLIGLLILIGVTILIAVIFRRKKTV